MVRPAVLFVDDEPNVLEGIRRSLRDHAGEWDSLFARDGAEALEVLARRPVRVVVTDIAMPVMDGKTLIAQMYDSFPEVVTLVLSGHWTQAISARQLGPAVRFLGKPIPRERLIAAIRDALGESALPAWAEGSAGQGLTAPSHRTGHDPSWLEMAEEG